MSCIFESLLLLSFGGFPEVFGIPNFTIFDRYLFFPVSPFVWCLSYHIFDSILNFLFLLLSYNVCDFDLSSVIFVLVSLSRYLFVFVCQSSFRSLLIVMLVKVFDVCGLFYGLVLYSQVEKSRNVVSTYWTLQITPNHKNQLCHKNKSIVFFICF